MSKMSSSSAAPHLERTEQAAERKIEINWNLPEEALSHWAAASPQTRDFLEWPGNRVAPSRSPGP